jgi:hypothetical protein
MKLAGDRIFVKPHAGMSHGAGACGAGESIKPGASAPGTSNLRISEPAQRATDVCWIARVQRSASKESLASLKSPRHNREGCRPRRGLGLFSRRVSGAYAPGFMLTPAPRVIHPNIKAQIPQTNAVFPNEEAASPEPIIAFTDITSVRLKACHRHLPDPCSIRSVQNAPTNISGSYPT